MDTALPAPENKSADGVELTAAFDEFRRTFETFRSENDRRIDEMGRKMSADVLTTEKVDRINQALDEQKRLVDTLLLKGRRPALGDGGVRTHRSAGGTTHLELWQPMPAAMRNGDAFVITAGCDKRFATCVERFGNGANFRGFPHMPGEDFSLSYARAGDSNDGTVVTR